MLSFTDVYAADPSTAAAPAAGIGASIAGFIPLVLIFGVFYFLVIRPQQKKLKEHNKLLESLKRGDKVVAAGGLYGTITKVDSNNPSVLHIEISTGVEIKILKSSVSEVLNKESANTTGPKPANS
ncbi:preprotein translocase subunit YajC [Anaplasma phagocytophilum]|uniref:Sec translocon accessory complex subunit YajC n=2 Tax=Anaplasma phagocytophilum TaxID=948 RepID=A0A0F3PU07_ANAPH|nr:preprotein translocase subunit YajC [Anaplasma phagocytophilum]EOA62542.1 preprotein translocase, YajC subunit [Anaplasma phagocytophilum str. CRT38]KDB56895.1 preprotein translocase subunit YajC [Anaplasma phagocytophilum str. CRT35]KJV83810.1 preprotein translocase, YajC subunit [Anaplasma phagocytophilum str. CRT53-1]